MSDYTLSVPFFFAGGDDLKDLEDPIKVEARGLSFTLKRDGSALRLKIEEFSTEDEARNQLARIWCGLAW